MKCHTEKQHSKFGFGFCKCWLFGMALFIFLSFYCNAYALNLDYLDEDKWYLNSNVTSVSINKYSNNNELNGVFKYYIDNENNCFYTLFSVTESSLDHDNCDVRVHYDIFSANEEYNFSIDKNGMCDAPDEEQRAFSVYQNFDTQQTSKEGLYITAVQFNNPSESNLIDISIYFNGHKYLITKGLVLEKDYAFFDKKGTSRTATKQNDKSQKTKTSESQQSTNQTTQTTKFSPQYTNTTKYFSADDYNQSNPDNSVQSTEVIVEESADILTNQENAESKMTVPSKILLFAGIGIAAVGIILLLSSAISKEKTVDKKDEEDTDDE